MNINIGIQLLNLFIAGAAGVEQFITLRDKLSEMKAEGRDPTVEEWDELLATVQDDSAQLDLNDKLLNGE